MSSPTRRGASSPPSASKTGAAKEDPAIEFLPPLKPRPKLLLVLAVLVIAWLIFLVVLRLKTVHRDAAPPAPSSQSSLP